MRELECQCLLENHDVDALAELRAQQCLAQREAALRAGQQRDERALDAYQPQHTRRAMAAQIACCDHGIDYLSANPGDACRQQAGQQRQQCERDQERTIGAPDQIDGAAAVTEYAEEPLQQVCPTARGRRLGGHRRPTCVIHAGSNCAGSGS
jgi:hypothetical protein